MKCMILDGNSIVNRAFYGVRALNAPDGTPTNAVYGFLAILQRLLDEQKPDALCVSPAQVNISGQDRSDKLHIIFCPRDRDIEPALSARSSQRAESHIHLSLAVLGVADTEHDRIPFVTLYVLQVLDKERFLFVLVKKVLVDRIIQPELIHRLLDHSLLLLRESYYAQ